MTLAFVVLSFAFSTLLGVPPGSSASHSTLQPDGSGGWSWREAAIACPAGAGELAAGSGNSTPVARLRDVFRLSSLSADDGVGAPDSLGVCGEAFSRPIFFGHSKWVTRGATSFIDTLYGVGLEEPCSISLVRQGEDTVMASDIERINRYEISYRADLSAASRGVWEIVITCSDMEPAKVRWLLVLPEVLKPGDERLAGWKGGWPPTIARATVLSEVVFIGKVERIVSEKFGEYLTKISIRTEDWLKGDARRDWVDVRLKSGTAPGGGKEVYMEEPTFELKGRVLVFALYPVERSAPARGTYLRPQVVCPIKGGKVYAGYPLEEFTRVDCLDLEDVKAEVKAVANAIIETSYPEGPAR